MDRKQIKEFCELVGIVEELKPVTSPEFRPSEQTEMVKFKDQWIEVNREQNDTLGFKLIKLKDQYRLCELGCGEVIPNQIIEKKVHFTPQSHWRTKCMACKKWVSPDGTQMIDSPQVYRRLLAEKNQPNK